MPSQPPNLPFARLESSRLLMCSVILLSSEETPKSVPLAPRKAQSSTLYQ
jgi:hypothetical protein